MVVEYDGTEFAGFQLQGKGERTVQAVLESAIEQVSGRFCRIHGAGRTDAGVHAIGQVVHFDTDWGIPAERIGIVLNNGVLPPDVGIRESRDARTGFHARFSATSRIYRYSILNRITPAVMAGRYALVVRDALDLQAMRMAASELVGSYDFAAFGKPARAGMSTVRTMEQVEVRAYKEAVFIRVKGNAFLKHMVRAFAGTLIAAGLHRLTPDEVRAMRDSLDRARCPSIAPPHGLCLVGVEYDGTRQRFETKQE